MYNFDDPYRPYQPDGLSGEPEAPRECAANEPDRMSEDAVWMSFGDTPPVPIDDYPEPEPETPVFNAQAPAEPQIQPIPAPESDNRAASGSPEQIPYDHSYMMEHPRYGASYRTTDGFSYPTTVPKPKKRALLPLMALCLCFTLIGGGLGGLTVLNLYSAPESPAPADQPTVAGAPNAVSTPNTTGIPDTATQPIIYQPGDALTPAQIYEQCNLGVVAISTETTVRNIFGQAATQPAAGSGFIISSDGYIVTNNHVIDGASSIEVLLADGDTYKATLIGRDVANDLAVLKIEASGLTALTWNTSSTLTVGSPIVAIGNPLGELANSATSGIISALDREINIDGTPMTMMQIDASVSPGNSGGPLFDQYGQVVGIVSAKSSGSGVEGIGFAIPSDIARNIINQLIQHGYVTGRPYLGISIQEVDASTAQYYNLPIGIYVVSVESGSCSEKAGLQTGDVIIELGGVKVSTQADLVGQKNTHKAGDTVEMKIVRAGNEITLNVTLDEAQPEETQPQQEEINPPWAQRQQPYDGEM